MNNQNLFEALQNVCGFTALESEMSEIINAYEKDKALNQPPQLEGLQELQQRIKKLEYMIENGLGWKDMENDITYPKEV